MARTATIVFLFMKGGGGSSVARRGAAWHGALRCGAIFTSQLNVAHWQSVSILTTARFPVPQPLFPSAPSARQSRGPRLALDTPAAQSHHTLNLPTEFTSLALFCSPQLQVNDNPEAPACPLDTPAYQRALDALFSIQAQTTLVDFLATNASGLPPELADRLQVRGTLCAYDCVLLC